MKSSLATMYHCNNKGCTTTTTTRVVVVLGDSLIMRPTPTRLSIGVVLLLSMILAMETIHCIVASQLTLEAQGLLQLKTSIEDPNDHLSSWSSASNQTNDNPAPSTTSPCAWIGVTCNLSGSVVSLDISNLNLSGTLPDHAFSLLPSLSTLNISCNAFSGTFPSSTIFSLPELHSLDISRNFFIGELVIPASASPRLAFLSAFSNNFTGPLPSGINHTYGSLEHLDLGGSYFQGTIPASYGHLISLKYLGLAGNLLSGEIPRDLGSLSSLEFLFLGYNQYTGGIPAELGNLTSIQYMDLCCTNLSGPIPPEFGNLKQLNTLFLYRNGLSGHIPPELGRMNSLMSLDLSVNNLIGHIPDELGELKSLTLLSLMYNNLNGSMPQGIGDLPNLLTLLIWNNSFSGELPQQLGTNSPLQWLDVSSNFFQGPIPPNLCLHSNLTKLILFKNQFSGPIPGSLAGCQSLLRVRIQDNVLSGTIPLGFGTLPKLTRLELQLNNLIGNIPLDFSSTSGSSDNSSKLSYLDLSYNYLDGGLPMNIWSLPSIQSFLASGNNLSGPIHDNFDVCPTLAVLVLSENHFSGKIPTGISKCRKLITIELEQNELTGEIPEELATMPNLGVLDLSQNLLFGRIPFQFQSSITLESFNVSYNNLSGPVPSEGMFKTASISSFVGNPNLCGGMLPQSCFMDGYDSERKEKTRIHTQLMFWLIGCVLVVSLVISITGGRYLFKHYIGPLACRSKDTYKDNNVNVDEWPWRLTAFQRLAFTSNDILNAVKLDENIIGKGASGVVYKAEMPSHEVVAVKKLWMTHTKSREAKGFEIEANLLGSIRHRNIVRLLGYCSNNVTTLLVYEYMTNGSLHDALHSKNQAYFLTDWVSRYNIAIGIAQGLCYLHHDCFPQIVHRDVKSNNILLDCNMEARLADFGLAKLVESNESMSMIAGSYGYIAPEYAYTLKVDEKIDIYSFGVVLLELLTGRRPIDAEFGEAANIVEWVRSKITKSKSDMLDALDTNVGASCPIVQEEMMLVLRIALLCTSKLPRDRPSMRDVVTMLAEAKPRRKDIGLEATCLRNNVLTNGNDPSTPTKLLIG